MKYFTTDLIVMGQSKDATVLNEQERLWDEAGDRYVAHLEAIRPAFPSGLQRLDDRYYLHDAVISSMGLTEDSFQIVLRLDTPPRSLLTLTYDLIEPPVAVPGRLPAEMCSEGEEVDWFYDEIEQAEGDPPTWVQSILLGDGTELRLHFRDVEVREHRPFGAAGRRSYVAGSR